MPVYRLTCERGHEWEDLLPLAREAEGPACPTCGAPSRRVPASASAQFRGLGWTPRFYPGRDGK